MFVKKKERQRDREREKRNFSARAVRRETVFNERRIFQLTNEARLAHAKLARARCKRQTERHKEKKTFRAWNNHDCLWPSSTCPASLARSWSRTILITRQTQTSKSRLALRLRDPSSKTWWRNYARNHAHVFDINFRSNKYMHEIWKIGTISFDIFKNVIVNLNFGCESLAVRFFFEWRWHNSLEREKSRSCIWY